MALYLSPSLPLLLPPSMVYTLPSPSLPYSPSLRSSSLTLPPPTTMVLSIYLSLPSSLFPLPLSHSPSLPLLVQTVSKLLFSLSSSACPNSIQTTILPLFLCLSKLYPNHYSPSLPLLVQTTIHPRGHNNCVIPRTNKCFTSSYIM